MHKQTNMNLLYVKKCLHYYVLIFLKSGTVRTATKVQATRLGRKYLFSGSNYGKGCFTPSVSFPKCGSFLVTFQEGMLKLVRESWIHKNGSNEFLTNRQKNRTISTIRSRSVIGGYRLDTHTVATAVERHLIGDVDISSGRVLHITVAINAHDDWDDVYNES